MRTHFVIAFFVLPVAGLLAQIPTPAAPSGSKKTLVRYCVAHLGNGQRIENAYIAIQGEELTMVADANTTRINEKDFDTIIDAEGRHAYPGFIVMDSRLGLTEIDQVKATHDYIETGEFLPNVRALPAYNSESKIIPTVRSNGVLMAQVAPVGNVISGSSSVVRLDAWTWQDAAINADEGIYLNWPARASYTGWWGEPGAARENDKYTERCTAIRDYFAEARAYSKQQTLPRKNLRFEAMRGLFDGSARLYVRVNRAKDMLDAIQFFRASGVKYMAVVGGSEAWLLTTELRENNIPVVIERVHTLPDHEDDAVDLPYRLAAMLVADGVNVSIATSGSMEAMNSRNLAFQAGSAVAYGLEYEKAVEAISLNPARLMGIDKQYGSIESGKKATFFLSSGDALDIRTNNVIAACVDGRWIDLNNHQIELYEKFIKKQEID